MRGRAITVGIGHGQVEAAVGRGGWCGGVWGGCCILGQEEHHERKEKKSEAW